MLDILRSANARAYTVGVRARTLQLNERSMYEYVHYISYPIQQ